MYARWKLDDQNSPLLPPLGAQQPPSSRIEMMQSPMLDLESQLNAALDGASWAVIAFAPEDALWADWLYRNLNGYPVAAPLVEKPTAHGLPRPDCLSIFPDRRDPEHAAHYPQAIEKSGYLVVVCSPHSAYCAEVDAQICAFKKAGGEERIIALVVEGDPEGALEKMPKTALPEWLPAWLRWRLAGDAFAEADRGEPRIVDARPGRTSLKEVRDILLATLLTVDAWELEMLGALMRPVETVRAVPKPLIAPPTSAAVSVPISVAPPRKVGPVVLTAAICVSITLATAWWSFGRVESDRTRVLAAPVQIVAPRIAQRVPQPPAETVAPVVEESAVSAPADVVMTASVPAPAPVPSAAPAVSAIQPIVAPVEPTALPEAPVARTAMVALHQRGDAAVGQRRLDEALGFYEEAVDSAAAIGTHASAEAKAEAALLCRKLGTLQLQMASTSEARASFVQGRKLLLQLKKQGGWNAERAKVLAELESSLRHLPRD